MSDVANIPQVLRAVAEGRMTVAEAAALPFTEGFRSYGLWNETAAECQALWDIQKALPPAKPIPPPIYSAEVERMQTGRDPLDEGE